MQQLNVKKNLKVGNSFPNARLLDLNNNGAVELCELVNSGRPLVLNFGSCSWPPFWASLQIYVRASTKFADVADFALIYIEEAHAADEWALKVNYIDVKEFIGFNLTFLGILD